MGILILLVSLASSSAGRTVDQFANDGLNACLSLARTFDSTFESFFVQLLSDSDSAPLPLPVFCLLRVANDGPNGYSLGDRMRSKPSSNTSGYSCDGNHVSFLFEGSEVFRNKILENCDLYKISPLLKRATYECI
jgi:hypothetical protein